MKKGFLEIIVVFSFFLLILVYSFPAWCEGNREVKAEASRRCLKRVTMLTGYGSESIEDGHYEIVPLLIQFHFDINSYMQKAVSKFKGDYEFIVEPLMNVVTNPKTNAEVGLSLLFRYENKIIHQMKWFLEGGIGAMYTTQHTHEQGSQYDFLPQAGLGLQYTLSKRLALTGEYRFRHMSNAGTASPNHGLNHNFALVGLTYYLD